MSLFARIVQRARPAGTTTLRAKPGPVPGVAAPIAGYPVVRRQGGVAEEEEQAQALRRQTKEEEEGVQALRRQAEEDETAQPLRRQPEEEQAAQALHRQAEEEERGQRLRRQPEEEEETAQALRRRAEEEEAAQPLRRQPEDEEEAAQALRRQAKGPEEEQSLRRQGEEEEPAPVQALRRQAEEEEEQAQTLRRQSEEEEAAQALRRAPPAQPVDPDPEAAVPPDELAAEPEPSGLRALRRDATPGQGPGMGIALQPPAASSPGTGAAAVEGASPHTGEDRGAADWAVMTPPAHHGAGMPPASGEPPQVVIEQVDVTVHEPVPATSRRSPFADRARLVRARYLGRP